MKFELKPFNRNVPDAELLADLVSADAKLSSEGKLRDFFPPFGPSYEPLCCASSPLSPRH